MFKSLAVICFLYLVLVSAVSVDVSVHVEDEAPQHHREHENEIVSTNPASSLRQAFNEMIHGHSAILKSASAEVDDADNNDGSSATIPIHYTNCGKSGDIASNLQILVSSWPPKSGADLTVKITGDMASQITGGHWQLQAKVFFFNINKKGDFPKEYMPVAAGPVNQVHTFPIPSIPFHGVNPSVTLRSFDQNNREIMCMSLKVKL